MFISCFFFSNGRMLSSAKVISASVRLLNLFLSAICMLTALVTFYRFVIQIGLGVFSCLFVFVVVTHCSLLLSDAHLFCNSRAIHFVLLPLIIFLFFLRLENFLPCLSYLAIVLQVFHVGRWEISVSTRTLILRQDWGFPVWHLYNFLSI